MNILALDPATLTGFAWTDGRELDHGVWNLGANRTPGQRLSILAARIRDMPRFDLLAFEEASYGASGRKGEGGVQWATVCWHNKLRGVIEMIAADRGAKTATFHPSTIKAFATGSGRAQKPQLIANLERHFGIVVTDDNESDAIWILKLAQRPDCWSEKAQKKSRPRTRRKVGQPRLF